LYSHFSAHGFSNTFLIAKNNDKNAVIVDPGVFDAQMLTLIEDNDLYVKHILITHSHQAHISGIKTLQKIYDLQVHAYSEKSFAYPIERVNDGDEIEICGMKISCIHVPGHSSDSICYVIGDMIFSGDVLGAGCIGSTNTVFAKAHLKNAIFDKLFPLEGHYLVLPGHGPPSTLEAEKKFNVVMNSSL
jgi:glyoxylase-like metal-dependent hydrolase (beta-lactamase superfamily II)